MDIDLQNRNTAEIARRVTLDTSQTITAIKTLDPAAVPAQTDSSGKLVTSGWVAGHRCTTAATTTSTASVNAPAYVVQNYRSGKSWYRLWSDGWLEQGGYRSGSEGGFVTFNLIKAFSTTDYNVLGMCTRTDATFAPCMIVNNNNKTTASFQALPNSTSQGVYWTACGY